MDAETAATIGVAARFWLTMRRWVPDWKGRYRIPKVSYLCRE
jgi:hypothetical protein